MLAAKLGARISFPYLLSDFLCSFCPAYSGACASNPALPAASGCWGQEEMKYGLGSSDSSRQTGKETTENTLYGPVQTFSRLKYAQLRTPAWGHIWPSETPGAGSAGREGRIPKPGRQTRTLARLCSLPSSFCGFSSKKKHEWGGKRRRMTGGLLPPLPTGSDTWRELLNCCVLPFSHLQDRNDNSHCWKRRE